METDASVETTVTADRTVVEYHGAGTAAVVVRSAGGERVYLPLEEESTDDDPGPTPYGGEEPGQNPYDDAGTADDATSGGDATPYGGESPGTSPYGEDAGPEPGVYPTADGFRVVHPEPATDVRVLR